MNGKGPSGGVHFHAYFFLLVGGGGGEGVGEGERMSWRQRFKHLDMMY